MDRYVSVLSLSREEEVTSSSVWGKGVKFGTRTDAPHGDDAAIFTDKNETINKKCRGGQRTRKRDQIDGPEKTRKHAPGFEATADSISILIGLIFQTVLSTLPLFAVLSSICLRWLMITSLVHGPSFPPPQQRLTTFSGWLCFVPFCAEPGSFKVFAIKRPLGCLHFHSCLAMGGRSGVVTHLRINKMMQHHVFGRVANDNKKMFSFGQLASV